MPARPHRGVSLLRQRGSMAVAVVFAVLVGVAMLGVAQFAAIAEQFTGRMR